ncbi:hypothetical protein [Micromonospora chersina]|uniref:hypothetical protein n=1 Tax=Micromonospora chersina TaxID=47854 RepID=UPI003407D8B8
MTTPLGHRAGRAGGVLRHRRRLPAGVEAALVALSRADAAPPRSGRVPQPAGSAAA